MAAGWCAGVARSYPGRAYGAVIAEAQAILHSSVFHSSYFIHLEKEVNSKWVLVKGGRLNGL